MTSSLLDQHIKLELELESTSECKRDNNNYQNVAN